jgi:hypothetical protein
MGKRKTTTRGETLNPNFPNDRRPDMKELGVSGSKIFAGLLSVDPNPALQGLNGFKVWQSMRFDPTGAALVKSLELPLRSARWFVDPTSDDQKDVDKADFIHDNLYTFGSQSMDDVLRLASTCLPFGFAVMEICYAIHNGGPWEGKVGWDKLAWRSQDTKWRWNMGEIDGRQELMSMTQLAPPYYQQIDIPRSKLLLFVNDQEGDNFDGWSLFRPAYKPFVFRDQLYRIQAVGLERSYMGIPDIQLKEGYTDEESALALQIVQNIRTDDQAGVVRPAGMEFSYLTNKLEGRSMQDAIEHHDTQIVASALADFLKLGTKAVGSFALSSDKSDLFLYALNAKANYFAEVFNLDPGIPQLIRYNFADADDMAMPRLQHGDIGERNMSQLGRTLMALGQFGFLTPDDQTEDKFRQMLDLPEREYSYDDRDLLAMIQTAQPALPEWKAGAAPEPRVPSPLNVAAATAAAKTAGGPMGGPGEGSPGEMTMAEAQARYWPEYRKFQELMVRNRWRRPSGRVTSQQRAAVRTTERLAELFSEMQADSLRPVERPSAKVLRLRQPYRVRGAEGESTAPVAVLARVRKAAGQGKLKDNPNPHPHAGASTFVAKQRTLAKSYEDALRPLLRGGRRG